MNFKEIAEQWLNIAMKYNVKTKTLRLYETILRVHIFTNFNNTSIDEITSIQLQNYINELNDYNLSINTIYVIRNILNNIFQYALNNGYIIINPLNNVRFPKKQEKELDILTKDEQNKLINYCLSSKTSYYGIIICLMTGIRLGELLALKWSDIDLSLKLIHINKTMSYLKENGKYTTIFTEPKTIRSIRKIPLSNELIKILKKIKKESISEFVISTKNGTYILIRNYQKTFELILKKLNIKNYRFHTLRHTFATNALELGMDIKTLSEILGHSSPTITLERYAHSRMDYKYEMMQKISNKYLK